MERVMRTSRRERNSFALFMAGQAVFNGFVGGYAQVFFTNMGITAVAVGGIFLVARLWDAVNDPMFGTIVDRSRLKGGRFLPWLRLSSFLVPIFMVLVFLLPAGLPMWGKILWAAVAYICYGMAYTVCDVPIFSMTSAITDQVHERVGIMARNTVFSTLTLLAVTILAPQLYLTLGWAPTAVLFAVPGMLFMLAFVRNGKERYVNKSEEPVTLKNTLRYLKENKYLVIFYLGLMVMNITATTQTVAAYFAAYCLGDAGLTSVLMMLFSLPALLVAVLLPKLAQRFDRFHILIFCSLANGVMCVLSYLVGYQNLPVFFVMIGLKGLFMGGVLVTQLMFTGDLVEYGEYKTGKRLQGIAYSIQTFAFKLFNAVAASAAMFILGIFGFAEGAGAAQSATTQNAIWLLLTIVPAIGIVLSMPIFARYKLRDRDVQLMAQVNSGEMTREEAEKAFTHPY